MPIKKLGIMLVDDDNDGLQTVGTGLTHAGFVVHGIGNPAEVLNHIEKGCKDCHVMVTDIRMPQMSGFQLVRRVNAIRPDMKIVMMTEFEVTMSEFQSMFPNSPVDRVLRKPFVHSKLAEVINELYSIEQTA